MKRLLYIIEHIYIFIFPVFLSAHHQEPAFDMVVTYVRGTNTREKTKKPVKEGDRISSSEKIKFSNDKDFIIAINPEKGRIRISMLEYSGKKKPSEEFELIANMMRLNWEMPTLGYRASEYAFLEDELTTDININPILLAMPLNKYLYQQSKYKVDANHFFFLQMQANGKSENEKLIVSGDTLIISQSNYSNLQSKTGNEKGVFYLGYFDTEKNKATTIKEISPYVDKRNESSNMVGAIINALKTSKSRSEIFNECYTQLYYFLGKPCAISLTNTISQFY
jgi:hypothetical protein